MKNNPKYSIYFQKRRESDNHRILQKANHYSNISRTISLQKGNNTSKNSTKYERSQLSRSISKIEPRNLSQILTTPKNIKQAINYQQKLILPSTKVNKFNKFQYPQTASLRRLNISQVSLISQIQLNPQAEQPSVQSDQKSIRSVLDKLIHHKVQEQSIYSETVASNFYLQKENPIFLCKNCLEYFNKQYQIKTHNKNCLFISWKYQYKTKWLQFIALIQQLIKYKHDQQLIRIEKLLKQIDVKKLQKGQQKTMGNISNLLMYISNTNIKELQSKNLLFIIQKLTNGIRNAVDYNHKPYFSKIFFCGKK